MLLRRCGRRGERPVAGPVTSPAGGEKRCRGREHASGSRTVFSRRFEGWRLTGAVGGSELGGLTTSVFEHRETL
ncbi:hypothetical protein LIA77_09862 [Sarocladium implicatum]|nr:hypothetical protein LIA77_09862 [Sarocladium implicatum]